MDKYTTNLTEPECISECTDEPIDKSKAVRQQRETDTYPAQDRRSCDLFSLRYSKLLLDSDAMRHAGRDAVLLVLFIIAREDRLFYSKPPQFWRSEIMERFGWRSPKDYIRIRKRAIEAGLLHYAEGDRMTPSSYWVLVPEWMDLKQFRKGNGSDDARSGKGTTSSDTHSQNGTHGGTGSGTHLGALSKTYTPNPKPQREKGKELVTLPEPLFISDSALDVLREWNRSMNQQCRLTTNREKSFRVRIKDPWWQDRWRDAIAKAAASRFCRGDNDRGWTADFEWFLKPDSATKLIEGRFDDRQGSPTDSKFKNKKSPGQRAMEEVW